MQFGYVHLMKHQSLLCALTLVFTWPLHAQAKGLVISAGPLASIGSTGAGRQAGGGIESTIVVPGPSGTASQPCTG